MTRVVVAAASAFVRAGLETLLGAHERLSVVGSAADLESLLWQVEASQPEVVVLAFGHETEEAVGALLSPGDEASPPAVIVLAGETDGPWLEQSLRAGLRAVLPSEVGPEMLVAAVEAVAAGLLVLAPEAAELLHAGGRAAAGEELDHAADALTPREVEVLGMLAEGLGNKIIAYRLGISEHTVKFHVASIFSRLGASSRTEAVTVGIRRGLIML